MNYTEQLQKNPASKGFKPYWLVFFTVAFLMLAASVFGYWALHSRYFARFTVDYLVAQATPSGIRLEVENVSGTIASGLLVEKARIRQAGKHLDVKIDDAHLAFAIADLLRSATISVAVSIKTVEAAGLFLPDWPDSVPAFSSFSCFAGLPANLKIKSLHIDKFNFRPHPQMLVEFSETKLAASAESEDQPLRLAFDCSFKGRPIGQGQFNGRVAFAQKKTEGTLALEIAQQKLNCEISLRERRRQIEISGFIATATIDITALSRWLSPLWQDDFPFGFDGILNFSGSWLYNNDIGFVGNIAGKLQKVRMVAMGLFIPIFELNADWHFFDGNLLFEDAGSIFVYFPAVLVGRVDSVLSGRPRWDVSFSSTTIDFAKFVAELPWGARYALALPNLAGAAEFYLGLKATRPEVNAFIKTDSLKAGKEHEARQINGRINYMLPASGPGECSFAFDVKSDYQLPPFFRRFNSLGSFAGSEPFNFSYSAKGPNLNWFAYEGQVKSNNEALIHSSGKWEEGFGRARAVVPGQNNVRTFFADNIQTLDLILAN